jgi:hypothetical protein
MSFVGLTKDQLDRLTEFEWKDLVKKVTPRNLTQGEIQKYKMACNVVTNEYGEEIDGTTHARTLPDSFDEIFFYQQLYNDIVQQALNYLICIHPFLDAYNIKRRMQIQEDYKQLWQNFVRDNLDYFTHT